MSRRVLQLSEIGWLLFALGCSTSAAPLGPPPGSGANVGGTTSSNSSAGGAPSVTGGAGSLGGALATGGTTSVQTVASTGGSTSVAVATGGSTGTATGATVVMALSQVSADTLQAQLTVSLPAGAASIPMSTLELTLCGQGNTAKATVAAMQIYDGRLTCPQMANPDCPQGQSNSFQSQVTISVTGTP